MSDPNQSQAIIARIADALTHKPAPAMSPDPALIPRAPKAPYVDEVERSERAAELLAHPTNHRLRDEALRSSYRVQDTARRAVAEWVDTHEPKPRLMGDKQTRELLDLSQLADAIHNAELVGKESQARSLRERHARLARWSNCYAEVEQLIHSIGRIGLRVETDRELAAEVEQELQRLADKYRLAGSGLETLARIAGTRES